MWMENKDDMKLKGMKPTKAFIDFRAYVESPLGNKTDFNLYHDLVKNPYLESIFFTFKQLLVALGFKEYIISEYLSDRIIELFNMPYTEEEYEEIDVEDFFDEKKANDEVVNTVVKYAWDEYLQRIKKEQQQKIEEEEKKQQNKKLINTEIKNIFKSNKSNQKITTQAVNKLIKQMQENKEFGKKVLKIVLDYINE